MAKDAEEKSLVSCRVELFPRVHAAVPKKFPARALGWLVGATEQAGDLIGEKRLDKVQCI